MNKLSARTNRIPPLWLWAMAGAISIILSACSGAASAPTTLVVSAADGSTIPDSVVAQAEAVSGVARVEPALIREFEGWSAIGLEPGAALRYISGGNFWLAEELEAGRNLAGDDAGQALIVLGLAPGGDMAGMTMPTNIGSSFELIPDLQVRIVGRFAPPSEVPEHFIFMPLDVAQAAFDGAGQVTHLFVTLETGQDADAVQADLGAALGTTATISRLDP